YSQMSMIVFFPFGLIVTFIANGFLGMMIMCAAILWLMISVVEERRFWLDDLTNIMIGIKIQKKSI
ncbi:MAG: hypothetical protein D6732_08380, partial [Methanobacteriota archaeon]